MNTYNFWRQSMNGRCVFSSSYHVTTSEDGRDVHIAYKQFGTVIIVHKNGDFTLQLRDSNDLEDDSLRTCFSFCSPCDVVLYDQVLPPGTEGRWCLKRVDERLCNPYFDYAMNRQPSRNILQDIVSKGPLNYRVNWKGIAVFRFEVSRYPEPPPHHVRWIYTNHTAETERQRRNDDLLQALGSLASLTPTTTTTSGTDRSDYSSF